MKNIWKWKDCIWMEIWRCSVAFKIIEKNGKSYRKNINTTGQCVHYPEIRCVFCNPECDHNCSIKIRILFGKEGYKKWIEKIDFRQKN